MRWRCLLPCSATVAALLLTSGCFALPDPSHPPVDTSLLQGRGGIYVDEDGPALSWVKNNATDPRADQLRGAFAHTQTGIWLNNDPEVVIAQVQQDLQGARDAGGIPVFVSDSIPGERCDPRDSPRAGDPSTYREWIDAVATAIGDAPAVLILEPGALGRSNCLSQVELDQRRELLHHARSRLAQNPNTGIILDGGPADPPAAPDLMASQIRRVGLGGVVGLSFNVGLYGTSIDDYAEAVREALAEPGDELHLIIDTARAGAEGPGSASTTACNPAWARSQAGSGLGGGPHVVKKFWVMAPGLSDGRCGIAPESPRGTFDPGLAMHLLGLDAISDGKSKAS